VYNNYNLKKGGKGMFKRPYVKAFLVRAAAAAIVAGAVFPVTVSANNPCIPSATSTADPAPGGPFNDTVYLYCTQDANATLGIYNINCWGTTDFVNWIPYGTVLTENNVAWSNRSGCLWAPHCAYFNGKYHLYFPEKASNGWFYVGHATNTTSPHTVFTADAQQMVINGARIGTLNRATTVQDDGLDPFVIMDTGSTGSGNNYLAWCICNTTPNYNFIGRLSPNGDSVLGAPTRLTNSNFYPDGGHYVEGQWWIKANATWYHIYACYYPGGAEQIGCATATGTNAGLLGTYTWRGWLMGTNQNSAAGTIHPGCCLYHGKWYLFWHCGGEEFGGSLLSVAALRSTGAEPFIFNGTGAAAPIISPLYTGATNWAVPKTYRGVGIPMAGRFPIADTIQMDRRSNINATTFKIAGASIAVRGGTDPVGHMVSGIGNNSWVQYDSVDFTPATGRSITGITARVAASGANTITVRLGSSTGTLLGTIAVANTGGLTTWANATGTLTTTPTTGVQCLCLVFTGTASSMNLNWVQFQTSSAIDPSSAKAPASAALTYQRVNKNTFMVGNAAGAEVKLFNMKGQEIADAFTSSGATGNLTIGLNAGALSSGSYVLSVKNSRGTVRVPFIY